MLPIAREGSFSLFEKRLFRLKITKKRRKNEMVVLKNDSI